MTRLQIKQTKFRRFASILLFGSTLAIVSAILTPVDARILDTGKRNLDPSCKSGCGGAGNDIPACGICGEGVTTNDPFTKYSAACSLVGTSQEKWKRVYKAYTCTGGSYSLCTDILLGGCDAPDTAPDCPNATCDPS